MAIPFYFDHDTYVTCLQKVPTHTQAAMEPKLSRLSLSLSFVFETSSYLSTLLRLLGHELYRHTILCIFCLYKLL